MTKDHLKIIKNCLKIIPQTPLMSPGPPNNAFIISIKITNSIFRAGFSFFVRKLMLSFFFWNRLEKWVWKAMRSSWSMKKMFHFQRKRDRGSGFCQNQTLTDPPPRALFLTLRKNCPPSFQGLISYFHFSYYMGGGVRGK